tara:strand:+ start:505 stop:3168 length:2664 start_codon:yes stop_codon:yes gene_type:complete
MATSNNNVVISRIQNRRGLKQDLPQPLRAGELGLALDSSQVYIGGDINATTSNISSFESTTSAVSLTQDIANTRILHFTVPHKRLLAGHFDGVSTTAQWTTDSNTFTGSGLTVFEGNITTVVTGTVSANISGSNVVVLSSSNAFIEVGDVVTGNEVTGTVTVTAIDNANITLSSNQTLTTANTLTFTPNNIKSISTNENFKATDVVVIKNDTVLSGDNTNYTPATSKDYSFSTTTLASNTHVLNLRVAPTTSDELYLTYYSNSSIIKALNNSGVIYPGTTTNSFYNEFSVPTYRQLNTDLVRVSPTTGTGHIGLEYKHIAVFEDSTAISSPSSLSLGNFLISDNSLQSSSAVNVSASGSTVTVSTGSSNSPAYGNAGSTYDFVYLQEAANSWLNGKALAVSNVQASTMEVTLPSGNSLATVRSVTSSASGAGNVVTITGNVEGLVQNDFVFFTGANSTVFSSNPYQVTGVNGTTSFTVVQSGVSEISGGLEYINYGSDNSGGNVQIISSLHGLPANSTITVAGSSNTSLIANGSKTVGNRVTNSTLFIPATAALTQSVTGTFDVGIGSATTAKHTPVNSINLSNSTTLDSVISVFQGISEFPSISYIPNTTNQIYVTTKASFDSLGSSTSGGLEFTLHDDSAGTMGALSLPIGSKTRNTHTIKAKLESWISDLVVSKNVPLFTSAQSNTKFSDNAPNLGTYTLSITNEDANKFITFTTRNQASDFNHIVNQIYFNTANPDIKGLVNLSTNIELKTSLSSGAGTKVTTFDDVESVSIPASATAHTVATLSTSSYDSYVIDYTVTFDGTSDGNYRRVGQLHASSFYNSSTGNATVVFRDDATDVADTVSGTVSFSAIVDPATNTSILVNAASTVNKITSMKYVTRRWNS